MKSFFEIFLCVIIGMIIGMFTMKYTITPVELETCESNLELLSDVYCQQLKIMEKSGSKNEHILKMVQREKDNPVCNY